MTDKRSDEIEQTWTIKDWSHHEDTAVALDYEIFEGTRYVGVVGEKADAARILRDHKKAAWADKARRHLPESAWPANEYLEMGDDTRDLCNEYDAIDKEEV